MIFGLLQQLQAMGLNVPDIMAQLGINQDEKLIETPREKRRAETKRLAAETG